MLRKCLKYDFKETFKLWWVGALTTLLSCIPMTLVMRIMTNNEDPSISDGTLLVIPLFFLVWFGMMIGTVISTLSVYIRYYRHFFGKEAYLTFTLPVKRSTLFTSKFISAMFFTIFTYVILFVGLFSAVFLSEGGMGVFEAFENGFSSGLKSLIPAAMVGAVVTVVYGIFLTAVTAINVLSYFLIITFCGVYFKKYSLLAIIVAFYILGNFGSFVVALPLAGGFLAIFGVTGLVDANLISMGPIQLVLTVGAALLLVTIALTAINMLLAFLSNELLERKLNVS